MSVSASDDDTTRELDLLLGASARRALALVDGTAFVAWFAEALPILCPGFVGAFPQDEPSRRSAFRMLGRLLWNRMPLPDNGFRPRPLPKPERNAPCPCGSARKYKHCCAHAETLADPFADVSLLKYVLEQYPRTQLRNLAVAGVDLEELGYIGSEWCREGRAADAEALLERVFDDVERLDARAQFAFDALADCYDELHRPKKKERLIERIAHVRDRTLGSAALHRRITILADRGERAQAWRLYGEAQRHEPDNPMLATLELTMLLAEMDYPRLQERGRFWLARLARDRDHDYADLIAHIRELVADPAEATLKYVGAAHPGLAELRQLLAGLPPIECHYRVDCSAGEARLLPLPELAGLVAEWSREVQVYKPDLTLFRSGDADAWKRAAPGIPWLGSHPLAWQSFDLLDDLALVVREADLMAGTEALLAPIVERAHALLRLVLERNLAADCAMPWGFLENRPALRLLASLIHLRVEQKRFAEARDLARWMVFTLNPNDNHGLREELVRLCLEQGDAQGALDVCDRYPDDALAGPLFDRPLALFMLGRQADAETALRAATRHRPKVLPMLLAENPKPTRSESDFLRIGGREEAWLYRGGRLALWEKSGALAWARGMKPRRKSG